LIDVNRFLLSPASPTSSAYIGWKHRVVVKSMQGSATHLLCQGNQSTARAHVPGEGLLSSLLLTAAWGQNLIGPEGKRQGTRGYEHSKQGHADALPRSAHYFTFSMNLVWEAHSNDMAC
jgi:hypothetical protein